MSRLTRRRVIAGAAALGLAPLAGAQAPRFPVRPVTMLVPWPSGGATDLTLRLLAELASHHLGQRVLTENRGGAGGTLAMPVLQQAEPDGYTIAQLPYPIFRAPLLHKVLWDPVRDVTPIIQLSGVTFGLLVSASSPFRSLDELLTFAHVKPGQLTIATNGVGTTPHVVLEELFTARGLSYIHVPYKGTSEQMLAVSTGQVMAGVSATGFAPAVDAGRLRLLVSFSAQRSRRWPQVPVLRELGFDIAAQSPYGLGGPRGLPESVVTTLHNAFKKALFEPQFVQELAKYDQEPDYLGPAEYAAACRAMYAREKAVVEKMGLARGS
jgi:tripartite-type tricarboxylate transporter receptor subunit TctC